MADPTPDPTPDPAGPVMRTAIVVRRPPADVVRWLIEPELTTRIWFDRSTGPLEPGALVTWTWDGIGAAEVRVESVGGADDDHRLVYQWGDTVVTWTFAEHGLGTRVSVQEHGFDARSVDLADQLVDTTSGHTKVLCALKAMVEHDVDLRIVAEQ